MSMQSLSLDFVKNAPPTKLGISLLFIGILFLSTGLWYLAQIQNQASILNIQLQALNATETNLLKAENIQQSNKNRVNTNPLLALNILKPQIWVAVLNHLEQGATDEVALLSIEPNAQTGKLQLVAEAKNYQSILTYMSALDASKAFEDIHLIKHKVQIDVPGQPVYFNLSATWRRI